MEWNVGTRKRNSFILPLYEFMLAAFAIPVKLLPYEKKYNGLSSDINDIFQDGVGVALALVRKRQTSLSKTLL